MKLKLVLVLALWRAAIAATTVSDRARRSTDEVSSTNCDVDESYVKLDLITDDFGYQTRWVLKKSRRNAIMRGPPEGSVYESNTNYTSGICLPEGNYQFVIFDSGKDGLNSPKTNAGMYALSIDGVKVIGSPSRKTLWRKRFHKFTVSPKMLGPTQKPTPSPEQDLYSGVTCSSSERKVKLEIKTDKWGGDTSWEVAKDGKTLLRSDKDYGPDETDVTHFCLTKGSSYDFILRDKVGDGMCCSHGEGYFKVSLEEEDESWREIISGGTFRSKELTYVINLKEAKMTTRDIEWLDSHNRRREKWHTEYRKTYVPLTWSEALKNDAKVWAEKLLDSCGTGMWHDPKNYHYGENVAANSGSGSWGAMKSTEDILTRFVEREEGKNFPQNSHLTQVLWRGSKYVGCAEASKPYGNNGQCHTQVCRYSRAGNCNMNAFKNDESGDWWVEPMLLDNTPCGYECPPDGCS